MINIDRDTAKSIVDQLESYYITIDNVLYNRFSGSGLTDALETLDNLISVLHTELIKDAANM